MINNRVPKTEGLQMTHFLLGAACGAVLLATVVAVGSHVFMEIADGKLAVY